MKKIFFFSNTESSLIKIDLFKFSIPLILINFTSKKFFKFLKFILLVELNNANRKI